MTIESATTTVTYGASAVTVIAGLSVNEWAVLGGLALGVATYVTNLWFNRQRLKILKKQATKNKQCGKSCL